jgi:hypothetical protein
MLLCIYRIANFLYLLSNLAGQAHTFFIFWCGTRMSIKFLASIMQLLVGEYKFPIEIIKNEWEPGDVHIHVGNPSNRPKPCVVITVYDEEIAILQEVSYYGTCSISGTRFERGSGGMHILVKGVLQWLMGRYPQLKEVKLTDKTFYQDIMLPEKLALTEGTTWYVKHFGAVPDGLDTMRRFHAYQQVHQTMGDSMRTLPPNTWTTANMRELLSQLPGIHGRTLSGTTWRISKETIKTYDIPPVTTSLTGGGRKRPPSLSTFHAPNYTAHIAAFLRS